MRTSHQPSRHHQRQPDRAPQLQRQTSHQYPYPTSIQTQNVQNAFQSSPCVTSAPGLRGSPRQLLERQPLPSAALPAWQRSLSPTPRKLGDTSFRYKDLGYNEIRLLRILPENELSTIVCEVLHTSLDGPRSYIAISYAWGDPEDTQLILLDGHEFPVTVSLWQAMQRLRLNTLGVIVWADAVSINQQNVGERNNQVQAMTRIYRMAYTVAVWLGPEADGSNMAMELLTTLTDKIKPFSQQSPQKGYIDANFFFEATDSPKWRPYFKTLVSLFDRDYWHRLWVVQEVLNAKDITVYCGSRALPWATYVNALKIFRQNVRHLRIAFPKGLGLDCFSAKGNTFASVLCNRGPGALQSLESNEPGPRLLYILLYHRWKLCADPRDKIFGILGIVSEYERSQFSVDYSVSIHGVYANVVDYLLTTTKRLDVICASVHFPRYQSSHTLPSWIPDWSNGTHMLPLGVQYQSFTAAGTTDVRFGFSNRRTRLEIWAVPLDEIEYRGIHLAPPVDMDSVIMAVYQWRLLLIAAVGFDTTSHQSFCRALNLDRGNRVGLVDNRTPQECMAWTYHSLATLLRQRYASLELDAQLKFYVDVPANLPDRGEYTVVRFEDYIMAALAGRTFFMTRSGLLCVGSGAGQPGNVICVPLGCSTPVILRQTNQGYEFVGDVYVDGYMYGKAMDELNAGLRQLQTFILL